MPLDILDSTARKVEHLLERVCALQAGDFAQGDSEFALRDIEARFKTFRDELADARASPGDPGVTENYCHLVLHSLFSFLPLLGFLHRSKSASNAFELYGPLKSLALRLLGPDTRIILSSEWAFSPYTYVRMADDPRYVLIGLPASEAHNALLVPLAGHELGHSAWLRNNLDEQVKRALPDAVVTQIRARLARWKRLFPAFRKESALHDPAAWRAWEPAYHWARRQCEEIYCDFVGLRLFDAAYLHAFAFLVAPGPSGRRPLHYPTLRQRAEYLQEAAETLGMRVPPDYAGQFSVGASPPPMPETPDDFLAEVADAVTSGMRADLLARADQLVERAGIPRVDPDEVEAIQGRFTMLAPADAPSSLAAPVNAAWRLADDETLWRDYPYVAKRRHDVLSELVAKSAQVLEYNEAVRNIPAVPD